MKIFVIILFSAVIASACAKSVININDAVEAAGKGFRGPIQEIFRIGNYEEDATLPADIDLSGIPSCAISGSVGNATCFAMCMTRNHKGGMCLEGICECVD